MSRIPYRLAIVATLLAAAASAAGIGVANLYRDAPVWVQQARGTDLATLLLAVPVTTAGLWASRRRYAAGPAAVVAGMLYLAYNYAIFAFAVAMNPLTLVHIAILGLSLWSLVLGARAAVTVSAGLADRLDRRASGGLLVAVGALFGLLWLAQIAATTVTGVLPPDLVQAGIATNPVYALDLAFFLPLCVLAGTGVIRRTGARIVAVTMLLWVPLMGAGVAGGFLLMALGGERVPLPVVAVIAVLSVASMALAARAVTRAPAARIDAPTMRGAALSA
jgi:hypothetical protein